MKQKTLTVMGGDARQVAVAAHFARLGVRVRSFGLAADTLPEGVLGCRHFREALFGTEALILPLPATHDSRHLYMLGGAEATKPPYLEEILEALPVGIFLAGGRFSERALAYATARGHKPFDYFKSEWLQQANAIPTAEGAVSVLMQELPRTVSGLSVLITGFGRVGRALCRLLLAMGAEVTVAARRESARAEAKAMGARVLDLSEGEALSDPEGRYAAIFNTVPDRLFGDAVLGRLQKSTLLIDLASAPGGIDAEAAAARGLRTVWALSLPGKYAPTTAGELIATVVEGELRREGIL